MAPRSRRILGLSRAFQAQSLALAHPCHARFGAANASERSWRTAKPVPHPIGMNAGGFSTERSRDAFKAASSPTATQLMIAQPISHYEILEKLGEGLVATGTLAGPRLKS